MSVTDTILWYFALKPIKYLFLVLVFGYLGAWIVAMFLARSNLFISADSTTLMCDEYNAFSAWAICFGLHALLIFGMALWWFWPLLPVAFRGAWHLVGAYLLFVVLDGIAVAFHLQRRQKCV